MQLHKLLSLSRILICPMTECEELAALLGKTDDKLPKLLDQLAREVQRPASEGEIDETVHEAKKTVKEILYNAMYRKPLTPTKLVCKLVGGSEYVEYKKKCIILQEEIDVYRQMCRDVRWIAAFLDRTIER